jgi:hypothetical protein
LHDLVVPRNQLLEHGRERIVKLRLLSGLLALRAGVPEKVIMAIGGWKTRTVFDRYSIIRQDDIRSAMQKFQPSDKPEINLSDNPVTIERTASAAPVN